MTDIATQLAEPFDKKLLRVNKAKGTISYIPISEVVARLNRVLGIAGWSYEVVRTWEAGEQTTASGVYPMWVIAHVRLTATIDGSTVTRDGTGGQQVKTLRSGDGVVDLGDEVKGAVSDALKKAAQHFGVGLDLARGEEAMAWEADQSDDLACPKCSEVIVGAKSDREPMRAHLVERHDYLRLEDGSVKAQTPGQSKPSTSGQEGETTPPVDDSSAAPAIPAKPALGAVRKAKGETVAAVLLEKELGGEVVS